MLAALYESGPGPRFHVLVVRLGISRDSLRRTLEALIRLGLVRRNPGYGHPLRPEYVLTDSGRVLGPAASEFALASQYRQPAMRKWTAPVIVGVGAGHDRFNALRGILPAVTPRALTNTLRQGVAGGLLLRWVEDGYPPWSAYGLTADAIPLGEAAKALAKDLGATF